MNMREDMKKFVDAIRGCLIGGAVGDALGYPVEFLWEDEIRNRYGEEGITAYDCCYEEQLAVISDDTQMTMFTVTGLLDGYKNAGCQDVPESVIDSVWLHYKDWMYTQEPGYEKVGISSLLNYPDLYMRRAPGNTCMGALWNGTPGTIEDPINESKGCGGIMRVAPVALYSGDDAENEPLEKVLRIDKLGAEVAALTHGHPLGYIPSAALVHIIRRIVFGGCTFGTGLYDIVAECREAMGLLFPENPDLPEFLEIFDDAVAFSQNEKADLENIKELGEGWVAEETFAIALYCALRYSGDFSKAVITAVNHRGDSDSTGAVTGNIVGALTGYEKIEGQWKEKLEFHHALVEMADELCYGPLKK